MHPHPVALVTGANRGLGRETARQLADLGWTVALCARRLDQARAAAAELAEPLGRDAFLPLGLDVTSAEQAQAAAAEVQARLGRLDALVNNAGAILESSRQSSAEHSDPQVVLATIDVNTLGALRVTQAMLPLLRAARERGGANVVQVSSGMGGVAEMGGGWLGYRLSKAALNALTRILHAEHHAEGLRVNSVCPGWVRTDMGGAGATRDVESGARGITWAATLGPGGPSGGFFRDGQPVPF